MLVAEPPRARARSGMDKVEFGARLRYLRELAKVSQRALAQAVGKPQPTIARWESGRMTPDALLIPKIAEALGCTLADLYVEPDAHEPSASD